MRRSLVMAMLLWPSFSVAMGQAPAPPAPAPAPLPSSSPKVVIAPPLPVGVGDIAFIDASASTGDQFCWVPLSGKAVILSETGKRAYFTSGTPGTFKFLVIGTGVVDGKAVMDQARVSIVVGDATPPDVNPPDAPDDGKSPKPRTPLAAAAVAYRESQAKALRTVAGSIRAGTVSAKDQAAIAQALHAARFPASQDLAGLILASPDPAAALIEAATAIEGGK